MGPKAVQTKRRTGRRCEMSLLASANRISAKPAIDQANIPRAQHSSSAAVGCNPCNALAHVLNTRFLWHHTITGIDIVILCYVRGSTTPLVHFLCTQPMYHALPRRDARLVIERSQADIAK